jgi:CheY-like chemotaxis protein
MIAPKAIEKGLQLHFYTEPSIGKLPLGDPMRLRQVIANLLSNAVKFTHEGGEITLSAGISYETDGMCELRIEISDNGIGIAPDEQARLFTAFEQAQSGLSRNYGGTGLGLAITKRIVELMGGNIWVESELGKGAKFTFTALVGRGGTYNDTNGGEGGDGENGGALSAGGIFKGKRMLVAEDIDINREILIALLEDTSILIDCAENGAEAVDMITANPEKYDIVLMDLQMPKMGGLEATKKIRGLNLERRSRLPIVAMTANVFKEDIEECINAGMDGHLGKPLEMDKVLEILRKYLC